MTKAQWSRISAILDDPSLSNEEKARQILQILSRHRTIDRALLVGILKELGLYDRMYGSDEE